MKMKKNKEDREIELQCEAAILACGGKLPDWHLLYKWVRDHEEIQPGLGKLMQYIIELLKEPSTHYIIPGSYQLTLSSYDEHLGCAICLMVTSSEGKSWKYEEFCRRELLKQAEEHDLRYLAQSFIRRSEFIVEGE